MPRQLAGTSEKSAAKPVKSSKSKGANTGQNAKNEDIHDLIATAAYYRAEHRGFNGGNEMEDWLEAEVEINTKLHH